MTDSTNNPSSQNQYDGRYYWLKLYTNFFESDDVRVIQAQKNGEKYLIFWIKLLLKAVQQEEVGVLRYKSEVPYTPEILATVTDTDVDTVRPALALFEKLGLIGVDEAGSILVEAIHPMVGSVTSSAMRMRKLRVKKAKQIESREKGSKQASLSDVEIEKEIEIEKRRGREDGSSSSPLVDVLKEVGERSGVHLDANRKLKALYQQLKDKLGFADFVAFVTAVVRDEHEIRGDDYEDDTLESFVAYALTNKRKLEELIGSYRSFNSNEEKEAHKAIMYEFWKGRDEVKAQEFKQLLDRNAVTVGRVMKRLTDQDPNLRGELENLLPGFCEAMGVPA